jgi:hypothetical protein
MTRLKGKLYSLPGGSVAKEFIFLYNQAVSEFADGREKSEFFICFPSLILQKDKNIRKTKDIRALLRRRLQMWRQKSYERIN